MDETHSLDYLAPRVSAHAHGRVRLVSSVDTMIRSQSSIATADVADATAFGDGDQPDMAGQRRSRPVFI